MLTFFDQMGNGITLPEVPIRIVSLVPSQTELLYDLGLRDEVIGITKFCVHPEHWLKEKAIVGGTKKIDMDVIDRLQPDLIIGNKEENERDLIIELYRKKYAVWMSDIRTVEDSFQMIEKIGLLVNREAEAGELLKNLKTKFDSLPRKRSKRVLYLIWRKPWMAAGSETFIHSMLEKIGMLNCLEDQPRYPQMTNEQIQRLNPEVVFLSSEPYPFREKHIEELQTLVPSAKVMLVDGEMFSWYGSRMLHLSLDHSSWSDD